MKALHRAAELVQIIAFSCFCVMFIYVCFGELQNALNWALPAIPVGLAGIALSHFAENSERY